MASDVRGRLAIQPGDHVKLSDLPADATPGFDGKKSQAVREVADMGRELAGLQERLYAAASEGDRRRVVVVLQGMDTAGKGGTVKHVISHLNPAGCRIRAFKAPSEEEKRQHFLWRIDNGLPQAGEIGIFDRSHYEDVLVVRVHDLVPESVWSRRYKQINHWERMLADDGVTWIKVFLHISRGEQRKRLLRRLDRPDKHWKFSANDVRERALWPDYRTAYTTVLERCSTEAAPWYVVPADHKWYRNWAVSHLLLEHLRDLDPRYPPGTFDPKQARAALLRT
ncbi:PPK2 family polyphosphate kinase [Streptomyces hainanensis]|uniref:Polyphosphate kinase 2 family protein n=1 Tax=Streptomyces hainanensis TaxID=402648 RepID=A0A4R4T9N9_9ACTN|nr:PPK2 family polyphosphate kinase [Streptomyces hainanensis]TDC73961.1 polyphosphate kinase 2 family protein [Streptomyces hainanensis]